MIELLVIPLITLAGPDDAPTPPTDHVVLQVWDDPARGKATCDRMLLTESPGTTCVVLPTRAPLTTGAAPQYYTEYNSNSAAGARLCAEDLRQDQNPESTCEVRPYSEYPGSE